MVIYTISICGFSEVAAQAGLCEGFDPHRWDTRGVFPWENSERNHGKTIENHRKMVILLGKMEINS
jgi:hypothetical protein